MAQKSKKVFADETIASLFPFFTTSITLNKSVYTTKGGEERVSKHARTHIPEDIIDSIKDIDLDQRNLGVFINIGDVILMKIISASKEVSLNKAKKDIETDKVRYINEIFRELDSRMHNLDLNLDLDKEKVIQSLQKSRDLLSNENDKLLELIDRKISPPTPKIDKGNLIEEIMNIVNSTLNKEMAVLRSESLWQNFAPRVVNLKVNALGKQLSIALNNVVEKAIPDIEKGIRERLTKEVLQ